MSIRKVCIVGGSRIPFCRSVSAYSEVGNKEMMTAALSGLVEKFNLKDKHIDEISVGAVLKRSKDFNLARDCAIEAGLAASTTGFDITQACGTSLEAAMVLGNKIALGQIETAIAGGVDTSSDVPIELSKEFSKILVKLSKARTMAGRLKLISQIRPKHLLPKIPGVVEPRTGKSMGEHCELMAQEWEIPREQQDELAFNSHKNAYQAYEDGFFENDITPYLGVERDNTLRGDTTIEKLQRLRPVFDKKSGKGTLTAGNSSPLTDGASCVFLCSEDYAKANSLEPLAYLTFSQTASVDFVAGEGLLMAPTVAVGKMLERAGLTLQDFDFYEIHEAFAAQVLCTLKAWEDEKYCKDKIGLQQALGSIDKSKLNVKGSSISLGHPFAATGTRILNTAAKLVHQKGKGRALISICTAGGMGVCAIVEK